MPFPGERKLLYFEVSIDGALKLHRALSICFVHIENNCEHRARAQVVDVEPQLKHRAVIGVRCLRALRRVRLHTLYIIAMFCSAANLQFSTLVVSVFCRD